MIGLHWVLFWFHKVSMIKRRDFRLFVNAILNTKPSFENQKKDQLGKIVYERIDLEAGATNF